MDKIVRRYVLPKYTGNLFWPILFCIIWPPLGVILLIKNINIRRGNRRFVVQYYGKWFWVLLFAVIFFPVSIILLIFKGEIVELEIENFEDTIIIP
jgi:hypothetical protein